LFIEKSKEFMKVILIVLFSWLTTFICFAQETKRKNTVTLNLGSTYIMRQDLIFSPLVHSDLSFVNVGLNYSREAKLFQKASLRFGNFNAMVSTPYDFIIDDETNTAYPHSFNFIDLDYLIGKRIIDSNKSTITIGGLLVGDIQAMNYVYGRVSSFGYYSMLGLGMFGRHQYRINEKSKFTTTLQLPMVAWLARSPYLVNDDEFIENISSHSGFKTFIEFIGDGQMATWSNMQTLDLEVKYEFSLSERWELGTAYQFEFIHVSHPRSLLSFRNSLNLFANYRF
jgi:hypothetical protein